jgi:hypothetical protein
MLAKPFEQPVRVLVGLGFPRQVNSVTDAYQMLLDWHDDSAERKSAMRACKAALAGEIDAETARSVFLAFARRRGILAPAIDDVVAANALGKYGSGASA